MPVLNNNSPYPILGSGQQICIGIKGILTNDNGAAENSLVNPEGLVRSPVNDASLRHPCFKPATSSF